MGGDECARRRRGWRHPDQGWATPPRECVRERHPREHCAAAAAPRRIPLCAQCAARRRNPRLRPAPPARAAAAEASPKPPPPQTADGTSRFAGAGVAREGGTCGSAGEKGHRHAGRALPIGSEASGSPRVLALVISSLALLIPRESSSRPSPAWHPRRTGRLPFADAPSLRPSSERIGAAAAAAGCALWSKPSFCMSSGTISSLREPRRRRPGRRQGGGGVEKGAWPYRSARAFADAARTRAARANARVHAALQVRFREVAAGALRELLLLHTVHVGLRRAGTGVATRRSGETADGRGSGQAAGERRRPSRAHERGAPQCSRTRLHRGGALPTVVERKAAALRWSRLRLAARRHRLRRHLGDYLTTRVTTRRSTLSLLTTPPRLLMRGHHESITVASLTQTMETFHRRHTVFVCAFETHDSSEGRPAWRARR